jgi:mannosyltransferase OCH1-like enzyme
MIPPTIHQVWLGGPMPEHLQAYRQSVIDMHPGWEHRLWGDDDFGWLRNQDLFDRASEIAPGHEGQLRSDIARYEILAQHGGVYVDCDMEALAPLDGLLSHRAFAGWELDGVWVNNAVLGVEPGHPLIAELVRRIPASVQRAEGRGWRPNRITGPHLITPVVRAHRHTVEILPAATFYPYAYDQLERGGEAFPDSLMVHHWDNARKRRGVPRG